MTSKVKKKKLIQIIQDEIHPPKIDDSAFYNLRSILGYQLPIMILLGARQRGKSYAVMDFLLNQWKKKHIPFFWIRTTDMEVKNLKKKRGAIEPMLIRKYKLYDIEMRSEALWLPIKNKEGKVIKREKICQFMSLTTFYANKGEGIFDAESKKPIHIMWDEFEKEEGQKATSVDVLYAFANTLENICRNRSDNVRIFVIGNLLTEASPILSALNFIPLKPGRYVLRKKKTIVDYIENSEAYNEMRKTSLANILMPEASTFSNKVSQPVELIYKGRLTRPTAVIQFRQYNNKFTLWDGKVIARFNNEKTQVWPMRPYLDVNYNADIMKNVIKCYDTMSWQYKDMATFMEFKEQIRMLKPRNQG